VYRKVIRSHICSEVRNNCTRSKISKLYVKYANIRKSRNSKKQHISIRSMHQVRSKRYRLHQCAWYVYTEPFLRVTDTQTYKRTVMCTVSRCKQSGTERKQEDPVSHVYAHIKYISCMFVRFGSNIYNAKTPCKKGNVSGKKCQQKLDKMGSIECTNPVTGRPEKRNKTVSED
jgi:hypothetical protein